MQHTLVFAPLFVALSLLSPPAALAAPQTGPPGPGGGAPDARRAAGSLDASFGSGGKVVTDIAGGQDQAMDVAVQPDGKIVVAGVSRREGGKAAFAVARYTPGGALDAAFGSGGKAVFDVTAGSEFATALAIQPDGKILVTGLTCAAGVSLGCSDFALVRLNADGTPDQSFGTGGKVTTDFSGGFDGPADLAVQADGKIVVVGVTDTGAIWHTSGNVGVARYNADGSLDTSFGTGGKVIRHVQEWLNAATSVVIQPDGKIVVGGTTKKFEDYRDFLLMRLNTNGSADTSFGSGGLVITNFGAQNDGHDAVTSLALQPDGKILAAGTRWYFGGPGGRPVNDFALARYAADGRLDTTFGTGGKVTTDFAGLDDQPSTVMLQADGKIVVGGVTGGALGVAVSGSTLSGAVLTEEDTTSPTRGDLGLVRYTAEGAVDASFGTGGKVTIDFFGSSDAAHYAMQADGKVVAGGFARHALGATSKWAALFEVLDDADFVLARVKTSDAAEPDFGISLGTPAITAARKGSGSVVVNIDRLDGFSGEVTVTAPNTKAIKVAITPPTASTRESRVVFTYKVKKKAPLGTSDLVFTAKDAGGRTRTATLRLTIQ